jgi:hypothetical protein
MGERTDAKRSIESSTRHMTEIAQELSRRASPRYIGEQAKEIALNKTHEWKEQMTSSPTVLGLIGGALGAAIGGALARNRRSSIERERFGSRYGYRDDLRFRDDPYREDLRFHPEPDPPGAIREKISDGAQELKDRASEVVSGVRERIPSAAELGEKVDENPMLVALGGLALGAVAALLLPVSRKEREMLDPVKQRAGEAIGTLGSKIGESVQQAQEKIAGQPAQSGSYPPAVDSNLLTH